MKTRNTIPSALLIVCLILLVGCCHKSREDEPPVDDGFVQIDMTWPNGITPPQDMVYAFYDSEGNFFRQVEKKSNETLLEQFPKGAYRVIVYNTDAKNVVYRGMDKYSTAEVYTTSELIKSTSYNIIPEPSRVFGVGKCQEFDVLEVSSTQKVIATVAPVSLTKHISMKFSIVNASDISSITGSLRGIAEGVFLSTGKLNWVTENAVSFDSKMENTSNQVFTATMEVFDVVTDENSGLNTNVVNVTVERPNSKNEVTVDITQAVQDVIKNNGGIIPLEIPVEIEMKMIEFGGMTATVKPWDNTGTGGGGL